MDRIEHLIVEGFQLLAELQEHRVRPKRAKAKRLRHPKVHISRRTKKAHSSIIRRPQYKAGTRGY
jgi:hypothetical protein